MTTKRIDPGFPTSLKLRLSKARIAFTDAEIYSKFPVDGLKQKTSAAALVFALEQALIEAREWDAELNERPTT